MSSVVVKWVDEKLVRRSMDEYATRLLATRPDVEEIVVFGSFEKGTFAPGSDLDVLVLLTASALPVRDRIPALLPDRFPVGIDLFPFTLEEVRERRSSPIMREVGGSRWRYRRDQGHGTSGADPR